MKPGTFIKLYELLKGSNDNVKLACVMQDMFTVADWNLALNVIARDYLLENDMENKYWNVCDIFVIDKLFFGYIDICYLNKRFTRHDIINFSERIITYLDDV